VAYSFLEHRSDVIILGTNSTFAKALEDVANGMLTQMGAEHAKATDSFELQFSAPTSEQLVVQLLSQIIAECETRPLTPKKIEVLALDEKAFSASVRVSGERKIPQNIIKAVTYHEFRAEKKGKNWEIQVLFDI
jgi:SHS2 domain-containing protein